MGFIRSQPRFRRAFPCSFAAVYGWGICAKNWQRRCLAYLAVCAQHTASCEAPHTHAV